MRSGNEVNLSDLDEAVEEELVEELEDGLEEELVEGRWRKPPRSGGRRGR